MVEPDKGYLHVIGGYVDDAGILAAIEKYYVKDMANINQYNFTTLTNKLTSAKRITRAIVYEKNIYE